MKRILTLAALSLVCLMSSCAPTIKQAETLATPAAAILYIDSADLIVPNLGGTFRPNWVLTVDVTPNYQTDARGRAWCPVRTALYSPKYGKFVRLHCSMPALPSGSLRRIVTTSGHVLAAQGFAYRDATQAVPIPLTLP